MASIASLVIEIWYHKKSTSLNKGAEKSTSCHLVVDKQSALMIMVNGDKQGHLEMLRHTVVQQCIAFKWQHFVKVSGFVKKMVYLLGLEWPTTIGSIPGTKTCRATSPFRVPMTLEKTELQPQRQLFCHPDKA